MELDPADRFGLVLASECSRAAAPASVLDKPLGDGRRLRARRVKAFQRPRALPVRPAHSFASGVRAGRRRVVNLSNCVPAWTAPRRGVLRDVGPGFLLIEYGPPVNASQTVQPVNGDWRRYVGRVVEVQKFGVGADTRYEVKVLE